MFKKNNHGQNNYSTNTLCFHVILQIYFWPNAVIWESFCQISGRSGLSQTVYLWSVSITEKQNQRQMYNFFFFLILETTIEVRFSVSPTALTSVITISLSRVFFFSNPNFNGKLWKLLKLCSSFWSRSIWFLFTLLQKWRFESSWIPLSRFIQFKKKEFSGGNVACLQCFAV